MPRLPPSLLTHARSQHALLPLLLRSCRDLPSALNELRWLREHAVKNSHLHPAPPERLTSERRPSKRLASERRSSGQTRSCQTLTSSWPHHLRKMCQERARGKPLQYILGTQPFGELEILCEKGVLIPRPETESLTTHLATLLLSPSSPSQPLRILDLCTGTGCIPLHLSTLLSPNHPHLQIHGIDNSRPAIHLSFQNLYHAIRTGHLPPSALSRINFIQDDIFTPAPAPAADTETDPRRWWFRRKWDVVICNPPYISPRSYDATTARSVRNWEPKSALVPSRASGLSSAGNARSDGDNGIGTGIGSGSGDIFYPRIIAIAKEVEAKVVLVEVADMEQAVRVVGMVLEGGGGWEGCEIWRDWHDDARETGRGGEVVEVRGENVRVRGEGNGRAVLVWRGEEGERMLGKK